ncbi:hypothetical protein [Deinococcus sp. QL22]|uniref:hypothetical protein n=1 Tax=Deinococcus sp. QL22 TaxID=2939437 RepID=UPI002017CD83|nr:hypothetical protein [Deinococcus sp. QL22]UQN09454.1 hypothetical protein M1R55_23145 [Deinococcus sp. QL22]
MAAKLTGNGYSTKHILRIAQRLRSSALSENFFVIILTPNPRKGQVYAAQHEAFFKVISVLPEAHTPVLPQPLVQVVPQSITPPGPHLSGEAWKHDPQYLRLPQPIQNVLQCPRDERIEQAMLSVECDGVMSAAKLKSFYALTPEDLHGIYRRETLLRTTPAQRTSGPRKSKQPAQGPRKSKQQHPVFVSTSVLVPGKTCAESRLLSCARKGAVTHKTRRDLRAYPFKLGPQHSSPKAGGFKNSPPGKPENQEKNSTRNAARSPLCSGAAGTILEKLSFGFRTQDYARRMHDCPGLTFRTAGISTEIFASRTAEMHCP